MTDNVFSTTNYLSVSKGRYTEQFKDKPFFNAYLKIVLNEMMELQKSFRQLMIERSLDTAYGSQLDIIGALVGQERVLLDFTAFPFFGFDGAVAAQTFGSLSNTSGGIFKSKTQSLGTTNVVDEETYRFLIKARIAANNSSGTPEDIIAGINFMTGNTTTVLEELGNAKIRLTIQNTLTDLQKYFLQGLSSVGSIVPVPIGVSVEYVFV